MARLFKAKPQILYLCFGSVQKAQKGTKWHKKAQKFFAFWTFSKRPKGTKIFYFESIKALCLLDVFKTSKRHKMAQKGTKFLCLLDILKTSKRHKMAQNKNAQKAQNGTKQKRPKGTKRHKTKTSKRHKTKVSKRHSMPSLSFVSLI